MIDLDDQAIAGRLVRVRQVFTGLNKRQFADKIGVHPISYYHCESGERTAPIRVLATIAEKFPVTLDWLVFGRPEGLPAGYLEALTSTDDAFG